MIELAEQVGMIEAGAILPTGVIVGSAVIEKVEIASGPLSVVRCPMSTVESSSGKNSSNGQRTTDNGQLTHIYKWHLTGIERAKRLRKPRGHPQPVWFKPF